MTNPITKKYDNSTYIINIAVSKEYRNVGIATKLFERVVENNNNKYVSLNVNYDNDNAFNLYKSLGFNTIRNEEDSKFMIVLNDEIKENIKNKIELHSKRI